MSIRIAEDRVIYDDDNILEICATDIGASEINPRIGGRKRVVVHADTLRLDSPIIAPGATVTLIARKAFGGSQATVNVSGIDGVDAPQVRPPTPIDAAAPPQDGKDGGSGGHAGSIEVLFKDLYGPLALIAVGGRGGLAQPGANGANGKRGYPDNAEGKPGGPGGDAGPPGHAGRPGTAGNGGLIRTFVDSGSEQLSFSFVGGAAAPAAMHGSPGTPGEGGVGGKRWKCYPQDRGPKITVPLQFRGRDCFPDGKHPDGQRGRPASPISDAAAEGSAGQNGSAAPGDVFRHGLSIPLRGVKLLGIDADLQHLRGNEEEAAAIAAWLFAISNSAGDGQMQEIRLRLSATLARISAGMPPVGIQGVYCSLRPIDFHINNLRGMLESRARARFYVAELRDEHVQVETVRLAAQKVISNALEVATLGKARLGEVNARLQDVSKQLDAIATTYWEVWQQVQKADEQFKDAVARKNPCASFLNTVIAVSMVVVTVASGGATAASIVAGGAEAFQWLSKDAQTKKEYGAIIDSSNKFKTRLEGYAKDAKGVATAAEKLKEFLGGDELEPPSDQVRISMSREDFNRMIEPYKGMAEAERLRGLMDKFFSMTETRNSLLIENTQLIVELATIRAAIATAQRQRDDFERADGSALLTQIGDVYEAALWADLEFGKRHLVALAEANSAFEYEWIAPRFVDLSSTRGEHIEKEYDRMLGDRRLIPVDSRLASVCEFRISGNSHKEVFDQLKGDKAYVSLMPGHVAGAQRSRWDERSTSLGIQLVFDSDYLTHKVVETPAMLTSMGVSWFKSEAGQMFSLKVPKRSAVSTARTALNMDLVQEERNFMDARTDIVEVSPFGVWALQLPGISEHLHHLQEIRFVFVGTARHSPDMRVAIRRYGDALLESHISAAQTAKVNAGTGGTAPLPLLPFDVDAEDAFYASPAGLRVREAVKMRLVEDAVFSAQAPAA
ncbi:MULTISPECIES: hypothetical protein [Delftia]|uniref:Uncharacterized protein n=1 Tax=Delftia lacustris TaxID=558537 RepID=A0A1H3N1G3_9BURK|nr:MULTISPECIES: hypothetical protein [Delftia]QPS78466.1 hypothetical protein I6G48_32635 [Delftia acidovorans]QPS85025.1 hypothetical protein I6G47_33310 [Delftia lacustris]SDY82757.1 hypothetical protein SAMN05421547_108133 [Delftia lacustris]